MIQSTPAAAASATDCRERACMASGRPSRWASSTASSNSSRRNAAHSVVPGPDPAILIRSTPSLTWSAYLVQELVGAANERPERRLLHVDPSGQGVADALLGGDLPARG